ncbi:MAG: efflux RND transporter permease subunit [Leptospirales bacterium]|nr:efflux RND transporter permease subunit [Leptospirales bacterium]
MNALIRYCNRNPLTVLMVTSSLLLLGLVSLFQIPITLGHGNEYPGLSIEVQYPGVTPDKIEEIIARPIEDAVATVGGIEEIFSSSEDGKTRVNIQFSHGTEINLKALEIRERIDLIAGNFPREAQKPVILRYDPDQHPVMIIVIESKQRTLSELRELAERQFAKHFSGINGVSEVSVAGGQVREILVDCDRQLLQSYGVSMTELIQSLQSANLDKALGMIEDGGGRYSLYANERFREISDVASVPLHRGKQGGLARVSDVASVGFSFREPDSASRVDGEDRIGLYVYRSSRASLLDISSQMREMLADNHPADVSFKIIYDQAERVRASLRTFTIAAVAGLFLAFLFLRGAWAGGFVGMVAVMLRPISFIVSCLVLYLLHFELNLLTIAGLLLTVGIALAFTVLIGGRYELGRRSLADASQYGGEILVGVLIVIATFFPIVFSSREARLVYGSLAGSIVISVVLAYISILALFPVLLRNRYAARNLLRSWGRFVRARLDQRPLFRIQLRAFRRIRLHIVRRIVRFREFRNRCAGRLRRWYSHVPAAINQFVSIGGKMPRAFSLIYILVVLLGGWIASGLHQDFSNPLEEGEVNIHLEFSSGTSFPVTDRVTRKVEERLKTLRGVRQITTKVEQAQASIILHLDRGFAVDNEYIDYLRQSAGDTDPAFLYISGQGESGALREVTVDCYGPDLATLDKITKQLANKAQQIPGVRDVVLRYKSARPEVQVVVDKVKSERTGISSRQIGEMLRFAIQGGVATKYIDQNREMDVRVRYKEIFRDNPDSINEIFLVTPERSYVPLRELATLHEAKVPVKIYRKNKKRTFSFSFRPVNFDYDSVQKIFANLADSPFPPGYRVDLSRDFAEILRTRKQFYSIAMISALLIYMILASMFESLRKPFYVLLPLPVPVLWSMIVLRVSGLTLTIPALSAVLMLSAFTAMLTVSILGDSSAWPFAPQSQLDANFFVRRIQRYLLAAGVWIVFFLPFVFVTGEGRGLLLSAAIVFVSAVPVACLSALLVAPIGVRIISSVPGNPREWIAAWQSDRDFKLLAELTLIRNAVKQTSMGSLSVLCASMLRFKDRIKRKGN